MKTHITHSDGIIVLECCKGDDQSQWRMVNFDSLAPINSLTDLHQNLNG